MIFILGASDPEMAEIQKVVSAAGHKFVFASCGGRRVNPVEAYTASAACDIPENVSVVLVECSVDVRQSLRVDHHNPGDVGFGRPPSEYLEASSLGQVLALLGLEATPRQRIIAAADHCLSAAYQGACPGVDPKDLLAWRVASRSEYQKRSKEQVMADCDMTIERLREHGKTLTLKGVTLLDLRGLGNWPELPDAQAFLGVSVICDGIAGRDGRVKINVMGSQEACRAFLDSAPDLGLVDTYGDPLRGIVGGFHRR